MKKLKKDVVDFTTASMTVGIGSAITGGIGYGSSGMAAKKMTKASKKTKKKIKNAEVIKPIYQTPQMSDFKLEFPKIFK